MNDIKALKKLINSNNIGVHESASKMPSFRVSVKKYVTNVDGTVINKAGLPAYMQTKYPVFLFNAFDQAGGYFAGSKLFPLDSGIFFINNDTYKNAFDLLSFSGANNIKDRLTQGDQYFIYSDSDTFPNFFVWIILSVELRSYASILKNPIADGLEIFSIQYSVDNEQQFNESITFINQNEVGNVTAPDVSPLAYKTVDYQQDGFIVIPMNDYRLTNFRGQYLYMIFDCDSIDLIYRYKKPY